MAKARSARSKSRKSAAVSRKPPAKAPKTDVEKFLAQLGHDKVMRDRVREAEEQVPRIAAEHGFHFTGAQLHGHIMKKWGAKKVAKFGPDTCILPCV
jgi:hypothetical protein